MRSCAILAALSAICVPILQSCATVPKDAAPPVPETVATTVATTDTAAPAPASASATNESQPLEAAQDNSDMTYTSNRLGNPEGIVDRIVFFDTPFMWDLGELNQLEVVDAEPAHLVLTSDSERARFPQRGTWTSPETPAEYGFIEFIPSWNAQTPEKTGVSIEARVRDAKTGEWSPWLFFGRWGETPTSVRRTVEFEGGGVHADYLRLKSPADAFQVRANLYAFTFDPDPAPSLRRLAVSYSGIVSDPARRAELHKPVEIKGEWARSLPVPFVTQQDGPASIKGSICSPTSVTMVCSYWGQPRPLVENALAIYDPDNGMFGNWSRAAQRAAELGLDSYVTRLRSWDQVKAMIAQGNPVIASIRFRAGEFPSAVFPQSGGHLIVVRGFTPEGDVIVNDPASREKGEGAVYKADELARAWFDKGGVAYILSGPKNGHGG